MGNHGTRLTLVPFASPTQCDALYTALVDLGNTPNIIHGIDWLNAAGNQHYGPTVLFLGDEDYPREQILSVLAKIAPATTLAIFQCGNAHWDEQILSRCSEFAGWPCHKNELALRLKRLQHSLKSNLVDLDEAGIIEEFVGLNMVGRSPAFLNTLSLIKKIARCDASVCIEGETGTGKELAARAIHYLGARRDQPFIPINCGAIPDNLVAYLRTSTKC